jgi:hypothetical protein
VTEYAKPPQRFVTFADVDAESVAVKVWEVDALVTVEVMFEISPSKIFVVRHGSTRVTVKVFVAAGVVG